jgi:hypothetical protein
MLIFHLYSSPSTFVIMSFGFNPAFSAGDQAIGSIISKFQVSETLIYAQIP